MYVTVNLCCSRSKSPARLWKNPKRTFLQNARQPQLPAPPPTGGVVESSHHPGPIHQQVYRGLQLFSKCSVSGQLPGQGLLHHPDARPQLPQQAGDRGCEEDIL